MTSGFNVCGLEGAGERIMSTVFDVIVIGEATPAARRRQRLPAWAPEPRL